MSQSDSSFLEPRPSHKVRASWLVSLSLILAVLIELCPTEVDLMYGPVLSIGQSLFGSVPGAASILLLLGAKAACLTPIVVPLLIYVVLNGRNALRRFTIRVTIIGVIVSIRLIQDVSAILGMILSRLF